MKAFHGEQKIKDKYLARVRKHRLADQLIKGTYWQRGKGCAVGCTVHSDNHGAYETELGIPRILARLEDGIFEGLPNDLAMQWPERFLDAIAPGADLSGVWDKFAHWMLVDETWGVLQFAKTDRSKKAIQDVADCYALKIGLETVSLEKWREVRSAAAAAAAAAADAYAYAADAYAYAAAAKQKWRTAQADKLIELLKAAK